MKAIYFKTDKFHYICEDTHKAFSMAVIEGLDESLAEGFVIFANLESDIIVVNEAYDLHEGVYIRGELLKVFCKSMDLETK